jgi:XTP/dITP diphosphohydrolase
MKIIIATHNKNKIKEISDILKLDYIDLISLDNFNIPETIEDKDTFKDNALKKAREVFNYTQITSLSDDSGLEVDALNGQPGIYSARFSGEKATSKENNDKLLYMLKDIEQNERTARFRCSLALVGKNFEIFTEGVTEGIILNELRGEKGFGYDPLFFYKPLGLSFAELNLEQKNEISHRAKAFHKMKHFLEFIKEKNLLD